jgi:hypothetical protein
MTDIETIHFNKLMIMFAILIRRAGNTVTITKAEFEELGDFELKEDHSDDDTVSFSLIETPTSIGPLQ